MSGNRSAAGNAVISWKKHVKHADINTLRGLDWSDSIEYLRKRWEQTPVLYRDIRAGEALDLIEKQPPSIKHFIEFLVTLYRVGFQGSECSQELLAAHISRVTHAHRFGSRTLRNAAKWAEREGFINQSWIPFGKRTELTPGEWRTMRLKRYTTTYRVRLLVALLRPIKGVINTTTAASVGIKPTPENSSANPNGELPTGGAKRSPVGKLSIHCHVKDDQGASSPRPVTHEESATADKSTRPERPQTAAQTFEHRRLKKPRSRSEEPTKKALPFSAGSRNLKSWRIARKSLLHELFVALKPGCNRSAPDSWLLYRIAELQTRRDYPTFFPAALSWDEMLYSQFYADWHGRRKTIDRELIPALRSFAHDWKLPDIPDDDPGAVRKLEDWEQALCPPGTVVRLADLENRRRVWPNVRRFLSAIHTGKTEWSGIPHDKRSFLHVFCDFYR